jgi:hypothetical protein
MQLLIKASTQSHQLQFLHARQLVVGIFQVSKPFLSVCSNIAGIFSELVGILSKLQLVELCLVLSAHLDQRVAQ